MDIHIELTDTERRLVEAYARLHSLSLEDAFKRALFDRIEEENDAAIADAAYREYAASGRSSRPFSALKQELQL